MKKQIMKQAWKIARKGQATFGCKVREYFSEALKIAWAEARHGGSMKAIIDNFKGTANQKDFAADIVNSAIDILNKDIEMLEREIPACLNNGKKNKAERAAKNIDVAKCTLGKINELLSGKKIKAKTVIESAEKTTSRLGAKGWKINVESI
jgi:hypothetical protein